MIILFKKFKVHIILFFIINIPINIIKKFIKILKFNAM